MQRYVGKCRRGLRHLPRGKRLLAGHYLVCLGADARCTAKRKGSATRPSPVLVGWAAPATPRPSTASGAKSWRTDEYLSHFSYSLANGYHVFLFLIFCKISRRRPGNRCSHRVAYSRCPACRVRVVRTGFVGRTCFFWTLLTMQWEQQGKPQVQPRRLC
jgi:hypothetical protein